MRTPIKNAAVLLSGSGRTLENFLVRIRRGDLPLNIVAVVSNRSGVRGLDLAEAADIPCAIFPRRDFPDIKAHNEAINGWLAEFEIHLIVLAGYLSFYIPPEDFDGPTVNIHPALLPKYGGKGYYGDRVHQAVLDSGDTHTGCTVHLVDDQYDHGRILGQREVPVQPGDDVHALADRVFSAECQLYPEVLARLVRGLSGKSSAG
ncbi:MAG: phosphoribosylglycinamide formyltransferase [Gemmatimonadales bacterium]|nr:phosphoribosylglycinamide formyltransferase [Gemmatimonadales bacterium]